MRAAPAAPSTARPQLPLAELRAQCCTGSDYELALRTLHVYASRLLDHPTVPKYRSISRENLSFHRRLGRFPAGLGCLEALGFRLTAGSICFERRDTEALQAARARIEAELGALPVAAFQQQLQQQRQRRQLLQPLQQSQISTIETSSSSYDSSSYDSKLVRMQNQYLDNIATLSEKVAMIDSNFDEKARLVQEQARHIEGLEQDLLAATNHEELLLLKQSLEQLRDENGRLLTHNQILRGRLSLVQGDVADDDIELAAMSDWTRDRKLTYCATLVGRLFDNSGLDSVSFLETVVHAMQRPRRREVVGKQHGQAVSRPIQFVPGPRQTILHTKLEGSYHERSRGPSPTERTRAKRRQAQARSQNLVANSRIHDGLVSKYGNHGVIPLDFLPAVLQSVAGSSASYPTPDVVQALVRGLDTDQGITADNLPSIFARWLALENAE